VLTIVGLYKLHFMKNQLTTQHFIFFVTYERRLLALPARIRLGWKGVAVTNNLAFYKHSKITNVKSPVINVIKLFTDVIFKCL